MTIKIGRFDFEGCFSSINSLNALSGVYAILGRNLDDERWIVVDIGESGNVWDRVLNHDRTESWKRQGYRQLACAVHYCDERVRMLIERELRGQFNPPCGDR